MRYVFGDYSLDTQRYELRRTGEFIPLGPQVFNVLAYLVAQRDRVVSRDELFVRLWPDQCVTDDALGRCIRAARRALEDRPEAPRYIMTTRGRGYRFIAPVQEQPHGLPEDGASTTVPAQSISRPLSTSGSEGSQPPVFLPTVPGDRHRLSEEFHLPSFAGEYKQVTVLCGCLADALALAMRLGPEAMHRCMQTVFTVVQQVLHRYAGSLIEFSGEGFVALFGAPVAQEDHAQRAVLAALALHEQLGASTPAPRQALEEPVALCLGLHTGRVVVDRLRGDPQRLYTAAGETTQVALRVQQLAAPGTTLLSAATQYLIQEHVWVEPQGEVQVSAAHTPVPVYGVRGIARQRSGVVGYGMREHSPFVGRARELALLQERLDAVRAGQGQVVAVVGEPGMGKSRLLMEYRRSLAEREVRYIEGHCLSYGSATPYLPLVELVRQLCTLTPGEPHEVNAAKAHRCLQQADLDPDEGMPLLLSLLDIPLATDRLAQISPPERKARTFALLRHLVLHEAQRHPCILTIENLHWSDAISEEWLISLVARLAGAPLLVLVTYRPGYQPPWQAQSYATQIALSRLRTDDSQTVVQAVLRTTTVSKAVVQEIVTRAAGNPFFLEELAWNVIEHAGQPAPLAVPETIEAVLAARIDRLSSEAKRLLQTAAVIGMHVAVSLLQAVTELSEAEILTHLGHLQTAEFLYETGTLPASAYTFKHALTQEVAYGSLLQERQRVLHARVVAGLEGLYAERLDEVPSGRSPDQVERLAYHAFRGELWDKACTYARQAGARALDQSAYQAAVVFYDQALEALKHLPQEHENLEQAIDLHLALRPAFVALYDLERQLSNLHTAERLATALNDPRRLGLICSGLVVAYRGTSNTEHALTYSQRCHALATASGDMALQIMASQRLGQIYYDLGNYQRATTYFRSNVASLQGALLYERFGVNTDGGLPILVSLAFIAWCLAERGEFAEGLTYGDEALRLVEGIHSRYDHVVVSFRVGRFHLLQGDVSRAIPLLERSLALSQTHDVRTFVSATAAALAVAYAWAGRVADTAPLLAYTPQRTYEVLHSSEAYLLVGRVAEARQLAQRALAHTRDHHEQGHQAQALWLLGEIARHGDPPEIAPAAVHYRQSLTLAEELGMRPLQAHCHLGLGTLHAATGEREQAQAELSTAIALYRSMEMTLWLPHTEAVLMQVEG